jgi:hypothetical protein
VPVCVPVPVPELKDEFNSSFINIKSFMIKHFISFGHGHDTMRAFWLSSIFNEKTLNRIRFADLVALQIAKTHRLFLGKPATALTNIVAASP